MCHKWYGYRNDENGWPRQCRISNLGIEGTSWSFRELFKSLKDKTCIVTCLLKFKRGENVKGKGDDAIAWGGNENGGLERESL